MKKNRIVVFVLFTAMMLTLACGLFGSDNENDASVVEEAAPAEAVEEAAEPTEVPPTEVPPTKVPPTAVPPTKAPPTPTEPEVPSWRMTPPEGSTLIVQDTDEDPQWEEIAAMHAATLAIPAPYYYELYVLRSGIKFPEVQDHYVQEMTARNYNMARNEQGANQMYLVTFLNRIEKTSRNALLFYAELSNRDPMVLVIYYNPIEE